MRKERRLYCVRSHLLDFLTLENKTSEILVLSAGVFDQTGAERNLAKAETSPGSFGTSGARRNCRSIQTLGFFSHHSAEPMRRLKPVSGPVVQRKPLSLDT